MRNKLYFTLIRIKEFWYNYCDNTGVKKAAVVLLFNNGKILAVSRKDNPTQMGLVGGKNDKGETFRKAAIRETFEETGLNIYNLKPVFTRLDGIFMCFTYMAQYNGDINITDPKETGIIKWTTFEEINNGPFGSFNKDLENRLKKLNLI